MHVAERCKMGGCMRFILNNLISGNRPMCVNPKEERKEEEKEKEKKNQNRVMLSDDLLLLLLVPCRHWRLLLLIDFLDVVLSVVARETNSCASMNTIYYFN